MCFLFLLECRKLNKKIINSSLLSLIAFSQFAFSFESFATSYFGSYLFCSSENGLRRDEYWNKNVFWRWSRGTDSNSQTIKIDDKYNNFTFANKSGTWINGFGDISSSTLQHYLLVKKTFENKQEAIRYCQFLENKCVKEFGPSFKYVGVSSWSIPQSAWGTIAVRYKEYKQTKWTACSNWQFSDYKELNYYPLWKVTSLTSLAAAGLVIYPWALGGLLGTIGPISGAVGTGIGLAIGIDDAFDIYQYISEKMYNNQD